MHGEIMQHKEVGIAGHHEQATMDDGGKEEEQLTAITIVDSLSPTCRICYTSQIEAPNERLIQPCLCSGTNAYVHVDCLNQWRSTSLEAYTKCTTCQYVYRKKIHHPATNNTSSCGNRNQATVPLAFRCSSWVTVLSYLLACYLTCLCVYLLGYLLTHYCSCHAIPLSFDEVLDELIAALIQDSTHPSLLWKKGGMSNIASTVAATGTSVATTLATENGTDVMTVILKPTVLSIMNITTTTTSSTMVATQALASMVSTITSTTNTTGTHNASNYYHVISLIQYFFQQLYHISIPPLLISLSLYDHLPNQSTSSSILQALWIKIASQQHVVSFIASHQRLLLSGILAIGLIGQLYCHTLFVISFVDPQFPPQQCIVCVMSMLFGVWCLCISGYCEMLNTYYPLFIITGCLLFVMMLAHMFQWLIVQHHLVQLSMKGGEQVVEEEELEELFHDERQRQQGEGNEYLFIGK